MLRVAGLPEAPLDAAAAFHAGQLSSVRARSLAEVDGLVLVFPPATREHRGWRLAVVQELAREAAPKRVNGVVAAMPRRPLPKRVPSSTARPA